MTYLHKFKCMACSLHFIIYSWNEDWPVEGTRMYCPECGSGDNFAYARGTSEEPIFTFVPGETNWIQIGAKV